MYTPKYTTHEYTGVYRMNFEMYGKKGIQNSKFCSHAVTTYVEILTELIIIYIREEVLIMHNVINAQKDDVFRIRMNSEIKSELEEVFAKNGLTLTDAVNVFFQQALNTGGFPFSVTEDNSEIMRAKALSKLMKELEIGMDCTESYSEEEAKKLLGL